MSEQESTESQEESSELLPQQIRVNTMEARLEHQTAKRFRVFHGITVVLGLTLVLLVSIWISDFLGGLGWSSTPGIEFNWHPLLMTIGMIFLYAQSMLIYRAARGARKRSLKLWHASLHCVVFILAVIGLKAVFDSHNLALPPIPNMYSLHSWIGLTTVILFSFQFVAGFITFLFPGLPFDLRTAYMHVHTSFGTTGFILAIIAAFLGIAEKTFFRLKFDYADLGTEAVLINCIGITLLMFGALVLYLVNEPTYKRVPLPEDDLLLAETQQTGIAE